MSQYKPFDDQVPALLKRKDKKRNAATMIEGILLGLAFIVESLFGFLEIIQFFIGIIVEIIINYLTAALFFSTAISGYFEGKPKKSWKTGIMFFVPFLIALFIWLPMYILLIVIILPFLFIVRAAGGYWGGLRCDLVKLYPLRKTDLTKN